MGVDGKPVCFIEESEERDESQRQEENWGPRLRERGSIFEMFLFVEESDLRSFLLSVTAFQMPFPD